MSNNALDNHIENYKSWAEEMLTNSNQGFVTEAGEVEKWDGGVNKERAEEALREGIEYLKSLKKKSNLHNYKKIVSSITYP